MGKRRNRYRKKNSPLLIDIGIGIIGTIFLISLGLVFAINFRFLYYADIDWFQIEKLSGLSVPVIKQNYNTLIDYCSPFYQGELQFPSLTASEAGLSHFAEVKDLFHIFYITLVASLFVLFIAFISKIRKGQYRFLLVTSITAIVLPIITLIGCAINFSKAFTLFHKIFFRNDNWLFDPATDPIITILPEEFFLQCAIVIIVTVFLGSLILYLSYRHKKEADQSVPLLPRKKNYYY